MAQRESVLPLHGCTVAEEEAQVFREGLVCSARLKEYQPMFSLPLALPSFKAMSTARPARKAVLLPSSFLLLFPPPCLLCFAQCLLQEWHVRVHRRGLAVPPFELKGRQAWWC